MAREKSHFLQESGVVTVCFSMDVHLRDCAAEAMDELRVVLGIEGPEELLRRPHMNQLHDALTLIKAGAIHFQEMYDEEGATRLVITLNPFPK